MMLAQKIQRLQASATMNKKFNGARVSRRVFVRAEAPQQSDAPVVSEPLAVAAEVPVPQETNILGATQEAINGRSAMLGFAAAVASEAFTHQSIWSQLAGKYVDTEMVEAPLGASSFGYFAVVVLVTVASLMPKLIDDLNVDSKSFGPFTPALENRLGRVAMLGFLGLLLVEAVKSSSLF